MVSHESKLIELRKLIESIDTVDGLLKKVGSQMKIDIDPLYFNREELSDLTIKGACKLTFNEFIKTNDGYMIRFISLSNERKWDVFELDEFSYHGINSIIESILEVGKVQKLYKQINKQTNKQINNHFE